MIRRAAVCGVALVLTLGCGGLTEHDRNTGKVQSALNEDPGTTSLKFHSASSGADIELRSVTPMGQADPIYMKYDGIEGESQDGKNKSFALFQGDILGGDSVHTSAAMAPLTAVLLGLATIEQFTTVTGLELKPVQLQPATDPPTEQTALNFARLAVTYAQQKDGDDAAALASRWVAEIGSCWKCPPPKGL
jgi:hypothetical protein